MILGKTGQPAAEQREVQVAAQMLQQKQQLEDAVVSNPP